MPYHHDPEPVIWDATDRAHLPGGQQLGWYVDEQGGRWPFIATPEDDHECGGTVPWGPGIEALAPHERMGRLPRELRERMGLVHRCGATTAAGRPCRTIVLVAGDRCGFHSGQPAHADQRPAGEPSAPPDDEPAADHQPVQLELPIDK